jgi:hypothetical protein
MDLLQILLVVLVVNLVVDMVCRRRAAEPWAKPLLLGMIVLDVVCLLPVVKTTVDLSRHKVDGLAGIVLALGTLLAAALLWLMYQYRSLFHRSGFPKQKRPLPNGNQ